MSGASRDRSIEVLRIVSTAGDVLVVECACAVPIGTRVGVPPSSVGILEPGAEPLRGKVIDVRRSAQVFAVTLRLNSVTRSQRDAIVNSCR